MELIRSVTRNSAFILIPAAAVSAFLPWPDLPFSILAGGLLGILNLKAMAWSVNGVLGTSRPGAKMLFFGQFRFVLLAAVIVLLAFLRLVNIAGILFGFSVVFLLVLIVGHRRAGRD